MNYRILFVISLLIIALGVGGLFLIGDQQPATAVQTESAVQPVQEAVKKNEKTITVAVATKALNAGQILTATDYRLTEIKVDIDDENNLESLKNNVLSLFGEKQTPSLVGFLLTENVAADQYLHQEILVSPQDSRFILESLERGQMAYRVYIKTEHQFLLDSLRSGDKVSLYAQHKNYQFSRENKDNLRMDEVLNNIEVLKIERFAENEQSNSAFQKDYVGYISVKLEAEQLTALFRLPREKELLPLPKVKSDLRSNSRGALIRALRG